MGKARNIKEMVEYRLCERVVCEGVACERVVYERVVRDNIVCVRQSCVWRSCMSTLATQKDRDYYQLPHLLQKRHVNVSKCHACPHKSTTTITKCHACHAKSQLSLSSLVYLHSRFLRRPASHSCLLPWSLLSLRLLPCINKNSLCDCLSPYMITAFAALAALFFLLFVSLHSCLSCLPQVSHFCLLSWDKNEASHKKACKEKGKKEEQRHAFAALAAQAAWPPLPWTQADQSMRGLPETL